MKCAQVSLVPLLHPAMEEKFELQSKHTHTQFNQCYSYQKHK